MSIEPSKIPSKRESIFGSGAGPFLVELAVLVVALGLVLLVSTLGVRAYRSIGAALFGEPQRAAPVLQPGESTVIDGMTIKRIN
jgi:hypothetical protein